MLLLVSACSAGEQVPSPFSVAPSASLHPDPAVKVTAAQMANADPCAMLHTPQIYNLGDVTIEDGGYFTSCTAFITTPGGYVNVEIEFEAGLLKDSSLAPTKYDGITVYREPGDSNFCRRLVVASVNTVIRLAVGGKPEHETLCQLADVGIESILPDLTAGEVPQADYAPTSLAKQDACRLITPAEAADVPGIDRSQLTRDYNGQSCTWGRATVNNVNLFVSFGRTFAPEAEAGRGDRQATIDGHHAVIQVLDKGKNLMGGCEVDVSYRPVDHPDTFADTEVLTVSVDSPASSDANCSRATSLTTAALRRLPRT